MQQLKLNRYDIIGKVTYIYLNDKYGEPVNYTIIDTKNLEKTLLHLWYYAKGYVVTRLKSGSRLHMHHFILGHKEGLETDHINRDSLDNRENNLRLCTRSQNLHNANLRKDNTSSCKGVHRTNRGWRARISINGKRHHLGFFANFEDACVARTIAETKLRRQRKEFFNGKIEINNY